MAAVPPTSLSHNPTNKTKAHVEYQKPQNATKIWYGMAWWLPLQSSTPGICDDTVARHFGTSVAAKLMPVGSGGKECQD